MKWRVGIAGLHRGQGLVSTLAAQPRVQIVALCDLDAGSLAESGQRFQVVDSHLYTQFEHSQPGCAAPSRADLLLTAWHQGIC